MFVVLQLDLPAALRGRLARHAAPRRRPTPPHLQSLNDWVSVSAFCLGGLDAGLPRATWSTRSSSRAVPAEQNPWQSRGLEWQVPTPVPLDNFDVIPEITGDPYDYGVPGAAPVARFGPASRRRGRVTERAAQRRPDPGRAARARGAARLDRLLPVLGRDDLLLRRLPVRVLLPAGAELARPLGRAEARHARLRPDRLRHRDPRLRPRQRRARAGWRAGSWRAAARPGGRLTVAALLARARRGRDPVLAVHRPRASAPRRAGTRASTSAGRASSRSSLRRDALAGDDRWPRPGAPRRARRPTLRASPCSGRLSAWSRSPRSSCSSG